MGRVKNHFHDEICAAADEENEPGLAEYDRKVEVIENTLYRLKERDYVDASDIRRIDEFLALPAECKVDFYDLIRYHAGPEAGERKC